MRFALPQAELAGYLLALIRASAWVVVAPPFGGRMLPPQVKAGVAGALALAVGPHLAPAAVPLETGPFIGAATLQIVAGLALGFLGVLVLGAVQASGTLIDALAGYSAAQLFDPMTSALAGPFGRLYSTLGTTLLFAMNGHILLVKGFITSFEAAPLTSISTVELETMVTGGLGRFMVAAVEIAAPLVAALLVAELVVALLSKAAPQANVYLLGVPLKFVVTLTVAGMALPLLPGAVQALAEDVVRQGRLLTGG